MLRDGDGKHTRPEKIFSFHHFSVCYRVIAGRTKINERYYVQFRFDMTTYEFIMIFVTADVDTSTQRVEQSLNK